MVRRKQPDYTPEPIEPVRNYTFGINVESAIELDAISEYVRKFIEALGDGECDIQVAINPALADGGYEEKTPVMGFLADGGEVLDESDEEEDE